MLAKQYTIDSIYPDEYLYLKRFVEAMRLPYVEGLSGGTRTLRFTTDSPDVIAALDWVAVELILTALKGHYYTERLSGLHSTVDRALLYTLMDFDTESERYGARDLVLGDNVSIDGIYNFWMADTKSTWDGYIELMNDFFAHSPSDSDKIELIGFMHSVSRRRPIPKPVRYYLSSAHSERLLQRILYYHEDIWDFRDGESEIAKLISSIRKAR